VIINVLLSEGGKDWIGSIQRTSSQSPLPETAQAQQLAADSFNVTTKTADCTINSESDLLSVSMRGSENALNRQQQQVQTASNDCAANLTESESDEDSQEADKEPKQTNSSRRFESPDWQFLNNIETRRCELVNSTTTSKIITSYTRGSQRSDSNRKYS